MNEQLFAELMESLEQGDAIMKGKAQPSRRREVLPSPGTTHLKTIGAEQVRELRQRYGMSQSQFSLLLGISAGTLRNWEQGRRTPEGTAQVLLRVADLYPREVLHANRGQELPDVVTVKKRRQSAQA